MNSFTCPRQLLFCIGIKKCLCRNRPCSRSDQLAVLTAQLHRLQSSFHFERQLSDVVSLEDGQLLRDDFSVSEQRLLSLMYKQWRKASVLPESFVSDFDSLKSQAQFYWQKARSADNPTDFLPYLSRIIESSRLYAGYMDPHADAYDVLLDDYEEGMTGARSIARDGARSGPSTKPLE